MSLLKVARMGHPVLRTRAREIERAELRQPSVQRLIDDMIDTMHEYHGVGLAAPQIHEGLRIFVAAKWPCPTRLSMSVARDESSRYCVRNREIRSLSGVNGPLTSPPAPIRSTRALASAIATRAVVRCPCRLVS